MSEERHPNLHAVGLLVDIFAAIRDRVRGDARTLGAEEHAMFCTLSETQRFVDRIEEIINAHTAELKKKETAEQP